MAEDFNPSALLAVLDIPELAGVPPELADRLRGLVRERARRDRLAMAVLMTAGSPTVEQPRSFVRNPRDPGGDGL